MTAIIKKPKFTNAARAQLASPISDTSTSIPLVVGQGALFPVLAAGEVFRGRFIYRDGATVTLEVFEATARSGDTLTVTRAVESVNGLAPVAQAFPAGAYVELVPTAELMDRLRDRAVYSDHITIQPVVGQDYVLSATEAEADHITILSGGWTAGGNVIVPAVKKRYTIVNNNAYTATAKTAAGSGVGVASQTTAVVVSDAVNCTDELTSYLTKSQVSSAVTRAIAGEFVRNGSFEVPISTTNNLPADWSFAAYGGGTILREVGGSHGDYVLKITSTVLANGGGVVESESVMPVGGGDAYTVAFSRYASVAGVSSAVRVKWYASGGSYISTTDVSASSSTETSSTRISGNVIAPATARFAKIVLEGGVPAVGTAVGIVYFDEIRMSRRIDNDQLLETYLRETDLDVTAGTFVIGGPKAEQSFTNTSYTEVVNFKVWQRGWYRVSFEIRNEVYAFTVAGRVYKNGVAYGTERATTNNTYTTFTEDLYFERNDTIQLFVKIGAYTGLTRNFSLKVLDKTKIRYNLPVELAIGAR